MSENAAVLKMAKWLRTVATDLYSVRDWRATDEEVWRPAAGFPGYWASSHGRIAGPRGLRRIKKNPRNGRPQIQLHRNGVAVSLYVHVLIVETFVGKRRGLDTAHKDGDRTNNRADNLAICERSANMLHRKAHGTARCPVIAVIERRLDRTRWRTRRRVLYQLARANGLPPQDGGPRKYGSHDDFGLVCRRIDSEQIRRAHRDYCRGRMTAPELAAMFSVSDVAMRRALSGKSYRDAWPGPLSADDRRAISRRQRLRICHQ